MSVIIKGMEIPENCIECMSSGLRTAIKCTEWTKISAGRRENERAWSCPLVDLGKHGDLIDRDEVIPKLKFINEAEHQIYGRESWGFTAKCINVFYDALPVIEAEDE